MRSWAAGSSMLVGIALVILALAADRTTLLWIPGLILIMLAVRIQWGPYEEPEVDLGFDEEPPTIDDWGFDQWTT